jgi:hypothetical protein
MAAARRVASEIGMPTGPGGLPSVFLRVAETDPLLVGPSPMVRRFECLSSLSKNGDTEIVDVKLPIQIRPLIDDVADFHIHIWKELRKDPIRYMMAALLDIYG